RPALRGRKTVVCRNEYRGCALVGHYSRRLEIVGVVADHDAEGKPMNRKHWQLLAVMINRPVDRRIYLTIDTDDGSVLPYRRRVVQPPRASVDLREANDTCDARIR